MFGCPPPAGCACGGAVAGWHARRSARASCSDSPWMSERRAPAQSEFHGAPRNRPDTGLPRSEAQGSQTGGRLSFGYFSLAKQRKVPRPPGRLPASALNKGTPPNQRTRTNTTKSIATSAFSPKNQNVTPAQPPPDKPSSPRGQTPSAHAQPHPPTGVPPPPTPLWSPETRCCRSSNTSR